MFVKLVGARGRTTYLAVDHVIMLETPGPGRPWTVTLTATRQGTIGGPKSGLNSIHHNESVTREFEEAEAAPLVAVIDRRSTSGH